ADLEELLAGAQWHTKEVAPGIVWKYFQFRQIFDSRQYVNIFEIDLSKGFKIEIPYVKTGFLKTSAAATANNGLVAFHGSYYNTMLGGSPVFFKYHGAILNQMVNRFNTYRENGAVVLNNAGLPCVVAKPSGGWSTLAHPVALAGGPLLILDGQELSQLVVDFNEARHPRTAVGITATNKMLVVVVDGRSSQSQGLTIPQLSKLMAGLGCTQALNLDGGGS